MDNTPEVRMPHTVAAEDHALAVAASHGDTQVFEILFQRYKPKMLGIALRFTRVHEDAEDIVQETFQKAFLHIRQFEGKASFSTWLTRIAINEALMSLRKRRGIREVSIENSSDDESGALDLQIYDSGPDPEVTFSKREVTEILRSAVGKLPARMRTAVELRELGELSTEETAKRTGVSIASVKARIFHGRRKLRKTLRSLRIAPKRIQRIATPAQVFPANF